MRACTPLAVGRRLGLPRVLQVVSLDSAEELWEQGGGQGRVVAVAEHVNVVPVKTPVFGEIAASTEKTGAVLMTVTVAEALPVPPSESVAVTTHSMTSSGNAAVADKSNVASAVPVVVAV